MTLDLRLIPRRIRGTEFFDDPGIDDALAARSLRDIARSNLLFGGTRAVIAELVPVLSAARQSERLTLLDVGTGVGDIPERARQEARRLGVRLTTIGLEVTASLAAASRPRSGEALAGDALALPLSDRSVDVVTCSQLLHHFDAECSSKLLRELQRVARVRVIISDLRRAWAAAGGLWLASWALGFHRVSRHDGVVSVLRGFRVHELSELVYAATGRRPTVRNRRGFRVTASWSPS
jgi:2-polyprenyl-3-methyl-5-hydroxy-6-metoxy-1,4-benzoquinol methylase